MKQTDDSLREQVRCAWQPGEAEKPPSFDRVWKVAGARYVSARQRYRRVASAAAIAAVVVVAWNWQVPADETTYIKIAELLESTAWSAPSDVLLPNREFDIYQDMPEIFESTEPVGGSLL